MSEMQANQYFISGRYSEAFSEYSKLPATKQNDVSVMEKMIICAALTENFERALSLLSRLINEKVEITDLNAIDYLVCPCTEAIQKLGNDEKVKNASKEETDMTIAILSFFTDRDKSIKYFQKLKKSKYSDVVNAFLSNQIKNSN